MNDQISLSITIYLQKGNTLSLKDVAKIIGESEYADEQGITDDMNGNIDGNPECFGFWETK